MSASGSVSDGPRDHATADPRCTCAARGAGAPASSCGGIATSRRPRSSRRPGGPPDPDGARRADVDRQANAGGADPARSTRGSRRRRTSSARRHGSRRPACRAGPRSTGRRGSPDAPPDSRPPRRSRTDGRARPSRATRRARRGGRLGPSSPPITNADRRPSSRQRSSTSRRWLRSRNIWAAKGAAWPRGRVREPLAQPDRGLDPMGRRSRDGGRGADRQRVGALEHVAQRDQLEQRTFDETPEHVALFAREDLRAAPPNRRHTAHRGPNAPVPVAVDRRSDPEPVRIGGCIPSMRLPIDAASVVAAALLTVGCTATPRGTPTTTSTSVPDPLPAAAPGASEMRSRATTARSTFSRCRAATTER